MPRFPIFHKSEKFNWSTNKIVYSIVFFCFATLLIKREVFGFEENFLDKILIVLIVAAFGIGFCLMLANLGKVKPLRGYFDGDLVFAEGGIKIKDRFLPLETIKKIQISNNDYYGRLSTSRGNLGPTLSNGTSNHLTIFFEDGKTEQHRYQLQISDDFQRIRKILVVYQSMGKIDFWHLANILGEKSNKEIAELKGQIDNVLAEKTIS